MSVLAQISFNNHPVQVLQVNSCGFLLGESASIWSKLRPWLVRNISIGCLLPEFMQSMLESLQAPEHY